MQLSFKIQKQANICGLKNATYFVLYKMLAIQIILCKMGLENGTLDATIKITHILCQK